MGRLDRTDGSWLAFGALAVLGAASAVRTRGSSAHPLATGPAAISQRGGSWFDRLPRHVKAEIAASEEGVDWANLVDRGLLWKIPSSDFKRGVFRALQLWEQTEEYPESGWGSRNNDRERGLWLDNDEGLYNLWKSSRLSRREFIRRNRDLIDRVIQAVVGGEKPAHYLYYEGRGRPRGSGARKTRDEKAAGRRWFDQLPERLKWDLGDAFVLGAFEWSEWGFDKEPSNSFLRGADEARIRWQMMSG